MPFYPLFLFFLNPPKNRFILCTAFIFRYYIHMRTICLIASTNTEWHGVTWVTWWIHTQYTTKQNICSSTKQLRKINIHLYLVMKQNKSEQSLLYRVFEFVGGYGGRVGMMNWYLQKVNVPLIVSYPNLKCRSVDYSTETLELAVHTR